jgi:methyltransferase (TIGR00027 family)
MSMNPVAITGLLTAAIRAEETARPDRLFEDPFAARLAGEAGVQALAAYSAALPVSVPIIEVRTRWLDEQLLAAAAAGARQVVLLAAGMDARAYRLPWPEGTRVFEIDQATVLEAKARALAAEVPRCQRTAISADLGDDWPASLRAAGFDPAARTTWLVEGLLQYLPAELVARLFARLDQLSAPGSRACYDCVALALYEAPFMKPVLDKMREVGAPWIYGNDEPLSLLPGWRGEAIDPAVIGNGWNRWPFPVRPGVKPTGYLVAAEK